MTKKEIVLAIKIIGVMLAAFGIASFLPQNPRTTILFFAKIPGIFLSALSNKISYVRLASTPISAMREISKGVYAKEDKELGTVYIKVTKDAERTEQVIEFNGRKTKIIYIK